MNLLRLVFGLGLSMAVSLWAEVRVTSVSELLGWAKDARAGSVVMLEDGVYEEAGVVTLEGIRGTEAAPVIIRARNRGKAVFRVGGFLLKDSAYVTVSGLTFSGPFMAKADRALVTFQNDQYCRLTGCVIAPDDSGVLPGKPNTRYSFLQLGGGLSNRCDYNRLQGKRSMGPMIVIRPTERRPVLEYNQFLDFAPSNQNGYEGLQLGNDTRYRMRAVIRSNWFENLDGEAEVISVKTDGNEIVGNTFLNNAGEVVVRAGNQTRIVNNLFLATGGKKKVGGVRNQGDDTIIEGNDFIGTTTGVQTQCGDTAVDFPPGVDFYDPPKSSLERAYRQSRRVQVSGNRMIDVRQPFFFKPADTFKVKAADGTTQEVAKTLPPTGWRISENRIQGAAVVAQGSGEVECTWTGNVVAGAAELGRPFAPGAVQRVDGAIFRQLSDGTWADAAGKPLVHPGVRKEQTGPEALRQ